jgi:hypothetical protein
MKIGILIPSTSNGRDWKSYKESYLFENTLKTFFLTYDNEHEYIFYIGIDNNDPIYDTDETKQNLKRFVNCFQNISIEFIYMENIEKGHLTVMWNVLFGEAYDDNCDYFYQCGDDIEFKTKGWVNNCIGVLQNYNNIGLTGPVNENPYILTQTFVSRKHMELFGYFFPEQIKNWFCDNWINEIYKLINSFYPLTNHLCINIGGTPRYNIGNLEKNNDWALVENHQTEEYKNKIIRLQEQCREIIKDDYHRVVSKVNS